MVICCCVVFRDGGCVGMKEAQENKEKEGPGEKALSVGFPSCLQAIPFWEWRLVTCISLCDSMQFTFNQTFYTSETAQIVSRQKAKCIKKRLSRVT